METVLAWLIASSEAILLGPITHHDTLSSTQLAICSAISILPSLTIIVSACNHVARGGRTDLVAKSDIFRWSKTLIAIILAVLELSKTRHRLIASTSPFPSFASDDVLNAFPCLVAIGLIVAINLEHIHTTQSSAGISIYLCFSMAADVVSLLGLSLLQHCNGSEVITNTTVLLKLALVILQELPKSLTAHAAGRKSLSEEERVGFLSRTFGLWIHSTLLLGFRRKIKMDDLVALGPPFCAEVVLRLFKEKWAKVNHDSTFGLIWLSLSAVIQPFALSAAYQIISVLCQFSMPTVLGNTLDNMQIPSASSVKNQWPVIATCLVYLGACVSHSLSRQVMTRACTMLSLTLSSALLDKNISLYGEAQDVTTTNLMVDIESIVQIAREVSTMLVTLIAAGLGTYLLWQTVGFAILPALVFKLAFVLVSLAAESISNASNIGWNGCISMRTSHMSGVLSNIKGIRMMGLEAAVAETAEKRHDEEIDACKREKQGIAWMAIFKPLENHFVTGSLIFGCFYFQIWEGGLDSACLFPMMLLDDFLFYPFRNLGECLPQLKKLYSHFERIRKFLTLPERKDPRILRNFNNEHLLADELGDLTPEEAQAQNRCIALQDVSVAATEDGEYVLQNLQLSICFGTLTIITGRTGSGKTLLLKTLLGEVAKTKGWIHVATTDMAYCGQTVWIPNVTLREAIIGDNRFNPERYEQVVHACCLQGEDSRWNVGDDDTVGTNGAKLSGGQKQRLALARAIYSDKPIVIADDTLSALDSTTARTVFDRVFGEGGMLKDQGRTAVLSTHSPELVNDADLLIHLDAIGGVTTGDKKVVFNGIVAHLHRNAPLVEIAAPQALPVDEEQHEWDLAIKDEEDIADRPFLGTDLNLYTFLFQSMSRWEILFFVFGAFSHGILEMSAHIIIFLWNDWAPANQDHVNWLFTAGAIAIVINLATFSYVFLVVIPRVASSMHTIFVKTVTNAELTYLTSTSNGSLLTRCSHDMTLLSFQVPYSIFRSIYVGSVLLVNTVVFFFAGSYSIVMILVVGVIIFFIHSLYSRTSRQLRLMDLRSKSPLHIKINETTTGIEHIRSFGWSDSTLLKSLVLLDNSHKASYYLSCKREWLNTILRLSSAIHATILVWLACGSLAHMPLSRMGAALVAIVHYVWTPASFIDGLVILEGSLGVVERLKRFSEQTPCESDDKIDPAIAIPEDWPSTGDIEFRNVSSTYNPSKTPQMVLEELSFSIEDGHTTLIAGKTGSGKSSLFLTFLKCIPYVGSVIIDGIDIANIPRARLRQSITIIPQDSFQIPDGTVRDNLLPHGQSTQPRHEITEKEANEALITVGLLLYIQDHGGLDASLAVMHFSAGQLQLLNLARALLHHKAFNSKIILMDEITSSLDIGKDLRVNDIVKHYFEKCTVLVISHRKTLDLTGYDARLALRRGRVLKHTIMKEVVSAEDTTDADVERIIVKNKCLVQSAPGSICGPPGRPSKYQRHLRPAASVVSLDTYQTRQADRQNQSIMTFLAKLLDPLQLIFGVGIDEDLPVSKMLELIARMNKKPLLKKWRAGFRPGDQQSLDMIEKKYAAAVRREAAEASNNELIDLLNTSPNRIVDVSNPLDWMVDPVVGRPASPVSGGTEILFPELAKFNFERLERKLDYMGVRTTKNFLRQLPGYPTPDNSEESWDNPITAKIKELQEQFRLEAERLNSENSDKTSNKQPEAESSNKRSEETSKDDSKQSSSAGSDTVSDNGAHDGPDDGPGEPAPSNSGSAEPTKHIGIEYFVLDPSDCPPPPPRPRPRSSHGYYTLEPEEFPEPFPKLEPEPEPEPEPSQPIASAIRLPRSSRSSSRSSFTPPPPSSLSICVTASPPSSSSSSSGSSSSESDSTRPSTVQMPAAKYAPRPPKRPSTVSWVNPEIPSRPEIFGQRTAHAGPSRAPVNRGLFAQLNDRPNVASQQQPQPQPPSARPDPSSRRQVPPHWTKPIRQDPKPSREDMEERNQALIVSLARLKAGNRGPRGKMPIYRAWGPDEDSLEAALMKSCNAKGKPLPRCWALARSPEFWTMEIPGLSDDGRPPSIDPDDGEMSVRSILATRKFFIRDLQYNKHGNYFENQELLRRIHSDDPPPGPGYEDVRLMAAHNAPYRPWRDSTRPPGPNGR